MLRFAVLALILGFSPGVVLDRTGVVTEAGTPAAFPAATPPADLLLYYADTSGGLEEWALPDLAKDDSWMRVDGMLVNDGGGEGDLLQAPYRPRIADYAVEAEVRMVGLRRGAIFLGFGLCVRAGEEGAYWGGVNFLQGPHAFVGGAASSVGGPPRFLVASYPNDVVAVTDFDPGFDRWQTYRIEVDGNMLRLLVNGQLVAAGTDDRFDDRGRVGLWSSGLEIEVRRFAVLALADTETSPV